jgi:ABC-type lipoprotein export system ATPase subunit
MQQDFSFLLKSHANNERQLIDRLRELKLDQYVDLPQIAVMGDTSCGKSSLLSAISGVTFPSSDQLTTRCPTQLMLSHAENFSGRIRLMRYKEGNQFF